MIIQVVCFSILSYGRTLGLVFQDKCKKYVHGKTSRTDNVMQERVFQGLGTIHGNFMDISMSLM